MPAGKRANYRSFSIHKVVEWILPFLLSLCALAMLVTSSSVIRFRNSLSKSG
jgi:hypothetical protein